MIARLRVFAERLESPGARRLVGVLFIATATTFTLLPFIRFLHSGTQMDYRTWFDAGQAVLHGHEIYPRAGIFPFMYPPPCALLLALPALFGKPAMILILSALNTIAWIFCIRSLVALAGEDRFRTAILLVPNLIALVFVWSNFHLGQPSLILLALMLGAFLSLQRNHQILAGVLIAFATAIKAFPLLAIFYLVYRRYWAAAISLVGGLLILFFVLPIPFRGFQQTLTDVRDWQHGMLRYQENGIAQRAARGYSWKNQSIFGVANRLLRHVSVDDEPNPPAYTNVANLDFKKLNLVIAASALLLGFSFVAAMSGKRSQESDALEFAALLILILIFAPLAFGYLFSWLMFPFAILTRRILISGSLSSLMCLGFAIALLIATAVAPRFTQIYGSLFFAALILYLALANELWREQRLIVR